MASLDELDVPDLTRRIASGDREAFAVFYEAAFDSCFARARALTGRDEAFCLDVVHETMLRVIRRLPPLGDQRALRAWLDKAVLHAAVDLLRADERRRRRERAWFAGEGGGRAEQRAVVADPSVRLEDAERRAWLANEIAALAPADRALFAARFEEGRTLDASGAVVGVGGDAAHGRIRRILERLRRRAREVFT